MKKILLLIMAAIMVFTLSGCGKTEEKKNAGKEKDLLQKIKDKGELVIATSPDYPPFEFIKVENGKDVVTGFEIEAIKEVAKQLGVKLVIKQMEFDGVLGAVKTGQVDMAVSGLTPTDERKKNFDFSELLYSGNQTYIVNKDDADKYKTKEDLKGKNIGAQMGSIQAGIAKNVGANNIKELKDIGALVLDVANKHIDALIISELSAEEYAKKQPNIVLSGYHFTEGAEGTAFAYAKGNESLVTEIDKIVKELISSGKLKEMFEASKVDAESSK
ncbi:MAG: bacterial extracellular solute-binding s, 3 family protein [Bacillales bacterium]|jgi:polar amino acid transport system substrate-binding protein|nr:bacterial extracellular solute-binding s, 3 family protein [Bacillales bacterium]